MGTFFKARAFEHVAGGASAFCWKTGIFEGIICFKWIEVDRVGRLETLLEFIAFVLVVRGAWSVARGI